MRLLQIKIELEERVNSHVHTLLIMIFRVASCYVSKGLRKNFCANFYACIAHVTKVAKQLTTIMQI